MFTLSSGVDTAELRTALGRFATGVAVVTTRGPAGGIGMTVNSFCSVSLDPPLVLFCLGHTSQLRAVLSEASSFAVNVLGEEQQDLSRQFSRPGYDRFGAAPWRPGTTGSPVIVGAVAVLECITEQVVQVGDHDLVIGRVVTLHPLGGTRPLVYFGGGYRRLGEAD